MADNADAGGSSQAAGHDRLVLPCARGWNDGQRDDGSGGLCRFSAAQNAFCWVEGGVGTLVGAGCSSRAALTHRSLGSGSGLCHGVGPWSRRQALAPWDLGRGAAQPCVRSGRG